MKKNDIICPVDNKPLYSYNSSTNLYEKTDDAHPHDGIAVSRSKFFVEFIYKFGDNLIIKDKTILYVGKEDDYEDTYNQKKNEWRTGTYVFKQNSDGKYGFIEAMM